MGKELVSDEIADAMKAIGRDVRRSRVALNLSAETFGERVGVSRMTISKIENGDPAVSFTTLARIAGELNLVANLQDIFAPERQKRRVLQIELTRMTAEAPARDVEALSDGPEI